MRLSVENLAGQIAELNDAEPAAIEGVYADWLAVIDEASGKSDAFDFARDGDAVFPQLVTPEYVASLAFDWALRSIPGVRLQVACMLRGSAESRYLAAAEIRDAGQTIDSVIKRALQNLSGQTPRERLRSGLERGPVALDFGDNFNAARILLVPRCLQAGEEAAVVIRDRDELVLGLIRDPADWEPYETLAASPGGPHEMVSRVVSVSQRGFGLH